MKHLGDITKINGGDIEPVGCIIEGGIKSGMTCKWLSDDFDEICTNGDCPYCADFCPVTEHPEICKFARIEKD